MAPLTSGAGSLLGLGTQAVPWDGRRRDEDNDNTCPVRLPGSPSAPACLSRKAGRLILSMGGEGRGGEGNVLGFRPQPRRGSAFPSRSLSLQTRAHSTNSTRTHTHAHACTRTRNWRERRSGRFSLLLQKAHVAPGLPSAGGGGRMGSGHPPDAQPSPRYGISALRGAK